MRNPLFFVALLVLVEYSRGSSLEAVYKTSEWVGRRAACKTSQRRIICGGHPTLLRGINSKIAP